MYQGGEQKKEAFRVDKREISRNVKCSNTARDDDKSNKKRRLGYPVAAATLTSRTKMRIKVKVTGR